MSYAAVGVTGEWVGRDVLPELARRADDLLTYPFSLPMSHEMGCDASAP